MRKNFGDIGKFGVIGTFGDMGTEITFLFKKLKTRRRSKGRHMSNILFYTLMSFTIGSNEVNHQNA